MREAKLRTKQDAKPKRQRRVVDNAVKFQNAKSYYAKLETEWRTLFNSSPHRMDVITHLCGRGCGCTSNQHTFERFVRVTRLYLLGRRFQPIQYKEMDSISRGLKPQAFGLMNNGILAKPFHIAMEPGSHVSRRMRRFDAPQQSNFDF